LAGLAGCGGRSDLLDPFQSEISNASGAGASTFGGQGGAVGQGGTFEMGGTFAIGGKVGGAGTPGTSGTSGAGQAGEPSMCQLSPLDCAMASEPECLAGRRPCAGSIASYERWDTTQYSYMTDVAVGRDDRVAVTGYHVGTTSFGRFVFTSEPTPTQAHGQRAYVASFDRNETLEWVALDHGPVESSGVSLALAANGDTLLQTQHLYSSTTGASLMRMSALGEAVSRVDWGKASALLQTALALDNDGRIWLGGTFTGALGYPGTTLTTAGEGDGYLLQLDDNGEPLNAVLVTPKRFTRSTLKNLIVDDEDSVLAVGSAWNDHGEYVSVLRKFSANAELLLEKELGRNLNLTHVIVDRQMRFTLIGSFHGAFENEGERFEAATNDLWLAQYSRDGELLWQKAYVGPAYVSAATIDPFGNIIVAGSGSGLIVGSRVLASDHEAGDLSFVLKLRANGTDVWAQKLDGYGVCPESRPTAKAASGSWAPSATACGWAKTNCAARPTPGCSSVWSHRAQQ
jgi:hypothetical protein